MDFKKWFFNNFSKKMKKHMLYSKIEIEIDLK
jgi:hypothetical protein